METIPKEAMAFMTALARNNDRDWFNARKPRFKELELKVKAFYGEVERLLKQHDDIQHTKVYRIYRDVRFSKDKSPYKKHLAAHFTRRKPQLRGGYYLHIQPGNESFIGCGFWRPNKEDLKRVRREWEIDADEIREITSDATFKKYWGAMQGETLKSAPMGFDRDHPAIGWINHKQWLFHHGFTDDEVLAPGFAEDIDACFRAIRPFFDYMSALLTTDLNGESLVG